MARGSSKSPRSPRHPRSAGPSPRASTPLKSATGDAEDEGVVHQPVKMSAVPSAKVLAPPKDLPSALREIDRLRAVQEKNAASAMAATRRAFDEQAQLEKKITALELAAERATAEAREAREKAEREVQDAKKSVKAAKKKTQKLEAKLTEQKELAETLAREAKENSRGEERSSQREIELEDRCARQERALEAAQGQIEELRTTLADERARGETKTSSQTSEVQRLERELREALDAVAATKEEADMTVESMRAALDAQVSGESARQADEEIARLQTVVDELTAAAALSAEDASKLARVEEKVTALERLLEGERTAHAASKKKA